MLVVLHSNRHSAPYKAPLLAQYEAESPAWILSPLSRYTDSFFYVVKTLPSLLLYVIYFYSCVIPSHPPFPKDLTADGDIESNPGPLSKDSLEYLNPGQWIDDDAIFQYCEYRFNSAGLAFDLILIAKTTGTRFLIAPINDGMTALSASRTFSGSHWGVILLDCVQNVATVIDPILNSNYLNNIVDKFREKMPSFTIRYANVPKSQTPSDCGIYVIAYVQKYLQILTTHESLSNPSIDFF
ncbi:hypothetical protein GEMRC1_000386 [Eukaryota sp. GEM-RC1]